MFRNSTKKRAKQIIEALRELENMPGMEYMVEDRGLFNARMFYLVTQLGGRDFLPMP